MPASWVVDLGELVAAELTDAAMRPVLDYHRHRIAGVLTSQPGLSVGVDVMGGFVNGYLSAGWFVPAGTPHREEMLPALGGVYLLAAAADDAPGGFSPAGSAAFFDRLTAMLAAEEANRGDTAAMRDAAAADVREALTSTAVTLNEASLAGFVMGLLYALPYLSAAAEVTGPVAMLAAAADLARELPT